MIPKSELILNPEGSIYHLKLKPNQLAKTLIFVGDPDRVRKISSRFQRLEFEMRAREFFSTTGVYNNKRLSVISTGIGTDNIDIVLQEIDALFNIDFSTRKIKKKLTSLHIIRIGTSGTIQKHIQVGDYIRSDFAFDLSGTLSAYQAPSFGNKQMEAKFLTTIHWPKNRCYPHCIVANEELRDVFKEPYISGITATMNGFYGPQGRVLRLPLENPKLIQQIRSYEENHLKITNFEMETAGIYGLSQLLGHKAISLNAVLANRITGEFAENTDEIIGNLITLVLEKITNSNL